MTIENIITRIKYDVINSFSMLDSWFDEDTRVLHHQPAEGQWSAARILEHVMLTNHHLLLLIDKASAKALKRAKTAKVEIDWNAYYLDRTELKDVGVPGSFVWTRPAHMEPQGNLTLDEVRRKLREQLGKCLCHLEALKNGEGVLCKTTLSVNNLGKLDVYEFIEFLTLHIVRHLGQLNNNRKDYLKSKERRNEMMSI